jgi:hypothetical protein
MPPSQILSASIQPYRCLSLMEEKRLFRRAPTLPLASRHAGEQPRPRRRNSSLGRVARLLPPRLTPAVPARRPADLRRWPTVRRSPHTEISSLSYSWRGSSTTAGSVLFSKAIPWITFRCDDIFWMEIYISRCSKSHFWIFLVVCMIEVNNVCSKINTTLCIFVKSIFA